ncbi:hypothetical protein BDN72DRAFT_903467 [Pluteus cervinus]|uniref:Uncharacterized protein n=1 Tax=Pluteus cervinus TaxID=181527 RepID=A0ACD3ABF5_9AGAR|nr:hypothetical protein BDN72DRAFT_903467 [Pluteus cervinus]
MNINPPNRVKRPVARKAVVRGGVGSKIKPLVARRVQVPRQAIDINDLSDDEDGSDEDDEEGKGGKDVDEDMDEDDEAPEFRPRKNLRNDINSALSGLDFKGSHAIAKAFPLAPNPWLTIEGLGLIGLPLSESDAKRIISTSRQAPYNDGDATVVDTDVRQPWEVSSQLVSLESSEWDTFMKENVLPTVLDDLGLTTNVHAVRFQLHKLLLFETDSQFLPHQDTPKVEGTFAMAVVILPSRYTGGEVHVSHSKGSKVLNLPPNSFFQASVLAWYADVTHSVKPVRSGYLLALSYHLINTVPNQPTLSPPPTDEKLGFVRRTLDDWHKGNYEKEEDDSEFDLLAFILAHRYSAKELGRGSKALKGKDAHIVTNLCPIAEEMGFVLHLASLEVMTTATRDYHYWNEDFEDITISDPVNLWGNLVLGKKDSITLEESQLVPNNAFRGATPDREEDIDDDRDDGPAFTRWYNRTVLILFHKSQEQGFIIAAGGLDHAISKLKKVNPLAPTEEDRQLAMGVIANLNTYGRKESDWGDMTKVALSWKNLNIWKAICEKRIASFQGIDFSPYKKALKAFKFKELRTTLEQILASTSELAKRLELIRAILDRVSRDDSVLAWGTMQRFQALETIESLNNGDVPLILEVAHTEGISETLTRILPSFHKPGITPDVWTTLLKAVRQSLEPTNATNGQADDWKKFIPECINGAIACWTNENSGREVAPPQTDSHSSAGDARARSAVELISALISLGYTDLSWKVLDSLLSAEGFIPYRFKYLFSPLVPLLRQALRNHNLSITAPPFSNFAQNIIGLYLRDVLGGKGQVIQTVVIAKLGCSTWCADCKALDAFMASGRPEHRLCADKQRRAHIEERIRNGRDVSCYTISTGRPYTLVVTKGSGIVTPSQWPARQANAQAFLKLFGSGDRIAWLMGTRVQDVTRALEGTQAFQWAGPLSTSTGAKAAVPTPTATSTSRSRQAAPSSSSALPSGSRNIVNEKVAGKKRKRAAVVSQGSIIDLTLGQE